MKLSSLIESQTEFLRAHIGIEDLKEILNDDAKKFHFKWLSENDFVISLNFSFGSSVWFDINYHNTKSDIIVLGNLTELTDSKTRIVLKTKSKYWLTLILIAPLIMLALELSMDLGIPILFYFVFPLAFIVIVNLYKSEDIRLIRNFKEYLNRKINYELQNGISK